MPEGGTRSETEIVLDPRQFALILDTTKGGIGAYVGPVKTSLSGTDQPVRFDGKTFVHCSVKESIQQFPEAREGSYIVLENPARDGVHPNSGSSAVDSKLQDGRKVNLPGPISFPLWPGQRATTLQGHALRSNQFLVAVVYNDEEANKNWGDTVVQPQAPATSKTDEGAKGDEGTLPNLNTPEANADAAEKSAVDVVKQNVGTLTMGKRLIIKGTEVSFYIPPTGIEVVPDEEGNFVRDAVTLETLEYCILVDEEGNKRYVRGPAVVFPSPTEEWIRHAHVAGAKKTRKFRAVELNTEMGIHVKVIADYEEGEKKHKEGDELFITGEQQRIYFPRAEHALVGYADKGARIFAVTIPSGEGRYVLDKRAEAIKLVRGSKIFLPDPRNEVIIRRVLSAKEVDLMFPGSTEAAATNKVLAAAAQADNTSGYVSKAFMESQGAAPYAASMESTDPRRAIRSMQLGKSSRYGAAGFTDEKAGAAHVADEMKRQANYTPPRELVLDPKYAGAVLVDVWTGYAIQVRNKTGKREVIVGPQPRLLEYDETLDALELSKSTPKTRKGGTLRRGYLRIANNRVSDKIVAETSDLVQVSMVLAYRVDFKGEPTKWFQVEDYVQLLTEHTRSMIRNCTKKLGVQAFLADSVALVRDMVLGKPNEKGERVGLVFEENGMVVKDVEVLDVTVGDRNIAQQLEASQHAVVEQELTLAHAKRQLTLKKAQHEIDRELAAEEHETEMANLMLVRVEDDMRTESALAKISAAGDVFTARLAAEDAEQDIADMTEERQLVRRKTARELELGFDKVVQAMRLELADKDIEAVVKKLEAIGPELTSALQVNGDKVITAAMIKELGGVAMLTGDNVTGVFKKIVEGCAVANVFEGGGIAASAVANASRKKND